MVSGRHAAGRIVEAIHSNRYDKVFLKEYDKRIYQELGSELKLSYTLQKLAKQAWLFNWVVKKANSNKEVRELITGMFEDLDMRSKLSKPGFYFNLLFS